MSNKSSIDYAELAGLRIALSNFSVSCNPVTTDTALAVKYWMQGRIKELENK